MKKEVVDLEAGDILNFPKGLYTDETTPFVVKKLQYCNDNLTIRIDFTNGHHFKKYQFDKVEVRQEK